MPDGVQFIGLILDMTSGKDVYLLFCIIHHIVSLWSLGDGR